MCGALKWMIPEAMLLLETGNAKEFSYSLLQMFGGGILGSVLTVRYNDFGFRNKIRTRNPN
jgi:hypothetical protein